MTIPDLLKKVCFYGCVDIKYYKNIRSYKKLIPSLIYYPDDIIITCDDDIFYRSNMVSDLINAYNKDKTKIYGIHPLFTFVV